MNVTILLPHYKTGKMTTYAVHKLLKHKGKHRQKIIVIDNGGGGIEELERFGKKITILTYPQDKLQSHGIAFDFALPHVKTEYFITVESDSFPTNDNWLDYYENLTTQGVECAGSLLKLSGGTYIHPAGAMYCKSIYEEAAKVSYPHFYFPNMIYQDGFHYHVMWPIAKKIDLSAFTTHHSYAGLTEEQIMEKAEHYKPVTGVFHNGMGYSNDHINHYGKRTMLSDMGQINSGNPENMYLRVGYEPGQWFCYWMASQGKKIFEIPTAVKWMQGRENQQQEFTQNEAGFRHLWGVTAYNGASIEELQDVIKFKENQMNQLYEELTTN